jgi:hypothetical protein
MSSRPAPLVSIIMPVYNQQDLLPSTLDSILSQTYPNFVICASDDRSTDGSAGILREYAARHPGKFELLFQEKNLGPTGNSNALLQISRGDYIAFFAGDDLMYPTKLESQVALMEQDPDCAICYHDVDVISFPEGEKLRTIQESEPAREGGLSLLLRDGCFFATLSLMARRTCLPKEGYNPLLASASDWLYFVECLQGGGKLRHAPGVLGAYRRHDDNLTSTADLTKLARCYFDTAMGLGIVAERQSAHPGNSVLVASLAEQWLAAYLNNIQASLSSLVESGVLKQEVSKAGADGALIAELERSKERCQRLRDELDASKETVARLRRERDEKDGKKASWPRRICHWWARRIS